MIYIILPTWTTCVEIVKVFLFRFKIERLDMNKISTKSSMFYSIITIKANVAMLKKKCAKKWLKGNFVAFIWGISMSKMPLVMVDQYRKKFME